MRKKKYIYLNHPQHPDTYIWVDEPDGYIINGLFYKNKDAVGNKGKVYKKKFEPKPVYFKPPKEQK